MVKLFYFFLDSGSRRAVVQGKLNCPGANYMLYGADRLPQHGFAVQHNLERSATPARWLARMAWLVDLLIRRLGGSSGDFLTVFKEWRRCRQADIVVSTVDNVGVPLAFLNYFGLLRRPLLYISIGLPERLAKIPRPLIRAFYKRLYKRIPCFVTYGWEEARRLRAWLGEPSDSRRVIFIPFGVDPRAFYPMPDRAASVDVLSIGADFQRDFQLLLNAAGHLPAYSFRIITSPHHAASFQSVPANVSILTNVPFPEMRDQLATARLVVLPCRENTYSSGTTTLLQAMAMAKPVVVSRTGAIRDGYSLIHDVNCRLVTPGSLPELEAAIQGLLAMPRLCRDMGAAARKTVEENLTWDHYVNRLATAISGMGDQEKRPR